MGTEYSDSAEGVRAALEFAEANGPIELIELPSGDKAASVPSGRELVSIKGLIDEYAPRPHRPKGFATLRELDSFAVYVNRHKTPWGAVVFSDTDGMRALFNAAEPSKQVALDGHDAASVPGHADFGAVYPWPLSPEWKAWAAGARDMPQGKFAEWLEEHIIDVCEPSESTKAQAKELGFEVATGARLMELSRGLSVNVGRKVAASVNTGTGECDLTFTEEHRDSAGARLKVPGMFTIAIPVFEQGKHYSLPVRLRYRVVEGAVLWSFSVLRADKAREDATKDAISEVATKTGVPVFVGSPAR